MIKVAAIMGALVLLASTAQAGSTKWTLPLPPSWADFTDTAMKEPAFDAFRKQVTDQGGRFEGAAFADANSTAYVVILTIEVDVPSELGALTAFEIAAREAGKTAGPEVAYAKEATPQYWSATQRIGGNQMPIATRRFEGFLRAGWLRAVSFNCYGDAAICDPVLASATVATSELRALPSADAEKKPLSYRIGYFLGSASLLIGLVVWWWKRRRPPAA
jgi:hypothetical protein